MKKKQFTLQMTVKWTGVPSGWKGCTDEQWGRYIAREMCEHVHFDGISALEDVKVDVVEIEDEESEEEPK